MSHNGPELVEVEIPGAKPRPFKRAAPRPAPVPAAPVIVEPVAAVERVMTNGKKKQVARLIKCECATCGYVVRTAQSWIDNKGAPHCPEHGEMSPA